MRKPFQAALGLAIVLGNSQLIFAAPRGEPTACHGRAISDLQRLSAHGYAVYQAMADKKQFLTWVACDDIQTELSTGVHESVHVLTEMKDGYPLIGGGLVRRPHEVSRFFPPKDIAKSLDARDAYVQNYLGPNGASSKGDLMYSARRAQRLQSRSRRGGCAGSAAASRSRGRPPRRARGSHDLRHALCRHRKEDAAGNVARAATCGAEEGHPSFVEPSREHTCFVLRAAGVWPSRSGLYRVSVRKEERQRARRFVGSCTDVPHGLPGAGDDLVDVVQPIAMRSGRRRRDGRQYHGS